MVRLVRAAVVIGAVLVLGACGGGDPAGSAPTAEVSTAEGQTGTSSTAGGAPGGTPGEPTDGVPGDARRWGTCLTHLAYREASEQASDPDPAVRAEGLATLRELPVPEGHEDTWTKVVTFNERFSELAAEVEVTDPEEFSDAMYQAMRSEPGFDEILALADRRTKPSALARVGSDRPCDPAGLPAGFGCDDPEACAQAWAAAAHASDEPALERLAMYAPTQPPPPSLVGLACDQDGAFATCTGSDVAEAEVGTPKRIYETTWARTTDGRWYGIEANTSKFEMVADAIG